MKINNINAKAVRFNIIGNGFRHSLICTVILACLFLMDSAAGFCAKPNVTHKDGLSAEFLGPISEQEILQGRDAPTPVVSIELLRLPSERKTQTQDMVAAPADAPQTWNCGSPTPTSMTAVLNTGTLTISGTGAMASYYENSPWYEYNSSITSIVVNEGVTSIGNYAFQGTAKLLSLKLPNSLKAIGFVAFEGAGLTEFTIPANVTNIANNSGHLGSMPKLTAISVAAGNTAFKSMDGVLFNAAGTKLIQYPCAHAGTTYNVPDGVTTIGYISFKDSALLSVSMPRGGTTIDGYAFSMSKIKMLSLPNTLTNIGEGVFFDCYNLETLICLSPSAPSISASAFTFVDLRNVTLVVPAASKTAYQNAGIWKDVGVTTDVESYFNVTPASIPAIATASSCDMQIMVNADRVWTITCDQNWAVPSQSSGTGSATIAIAVAANPGAGRNANITITSSGSTKAITVYQDSIQDGVVTLQGDSLATTTVSEYHWNNLISETGFYSELQNITNAVYGKFKDDFDFIFYVLDTNSSAGTVQSLGFYGVNLSASNAVKGLGKNIFNNAAGWGSSGKLQSVMYYPYATAIMSGPALHELCHNWAAYICPTYDVDNSPFGGHWGVSNAGGQLGGFKYVRVIEQNSGGVAGRTKYEASFSSRETNPDGSFKYPGFGTFANGGNGLPYSDIELYLMGMKSAQELRNGNFRLDIYSGNSYEAAQSGVFYSTSVQSYTIDDIIAKNGARVPDVNTSQKHFKILTVCISREKNTAHYYNDIIKAVGWFAGPMNDNTYPNIYNFQQATYGVGSLEMAGLSGSLKSLSIVMQPMSQTVTQGQAVAFSVSIGGASSPTYQWQVSTDGGIAWANIAGAEGTTLTLSAATGDMNNNQYRCVITDSLGSITSNAVTLTVTVAPVAPAFTTQPLSRTIAAGENASLTVVANGNPTPTYQWQSSPNGSAWTNLANATPYSGATTGTLAITAATFAMNGTQYRCVATNSQGNANSNPATLTVTPDAATLAAQQLKAQLESSGTATITLSGTVNLSLVGGATVASGKTIVGADASSAISGNVTIPSGAKDVVIIGVTITGGTLGINGASDVEITHCTFTNAPVSVSGGADNIAFSWNKFTATAGGGGSAMTVSNAGAATGIILHHNLFGEGLKSDMPAATNARVYMFNNYIAATGNTTATIAGAGAQILSINNVYQGASNPITKQSNGLLRATGNFMSQTTGAPASGEDKVFVPGYAHVMQPAGIDAPLNAETLVGLITANAGNTAGQNSATPASTNGTARISATVTGAGASTTNTSASVPDAGGFTLAANATGFTSSKQQWYRDNFAIASATAATHSVTGANAATHAGAYAVSMTAASGEIVTSPAFTVTVGNPVPPVITTHPASQTITAGGGATFTVVATGANLTYQWQKNGANISGATGASHSIANAQQSDAGNYRVIVTNAGGSVTSNAAALTVNTSGGNGGGGSGGGGGGGGGAPTVWYFAALAVLLAASAGRRHCKND